MTNEVEYDCSTVAAIPHNDKHDEGFTVIATPAETFDPTTTNNPIVFDN